MCSARSQNLKQMCVDLCTQWKRLPSAKFRKPCLEFVFARIDPGNLPDISMSRRVLNPQDQFVHLHRHRTRQIKFFASNLHRIVHLTLERRLGNRQALTHFFSSQSHTLEKFSVVGPSHQSFHCHQLFLPVGGNKKIYGLFLRSSYFLLSI